MIVSFATGRTAASRSTLALLTLYSSLTGIALAQSKPASSSPQQGTAQGPAPKSQVEKSNAEETPTVLVQLNGALEALAAKVSPAVVQILVTGYGPLREED